MKKVILWDKSTIYVTDEQAVKIMRAKQLGKSIQVSMPGGDYEFLAPNAVTRITGAGYEMPEQVDKDHRIESKVELTDEDRAKNHEKIQQMKADFLRAAEERRQKNDKNSNTSI